jgi:hypothetical protein
LELFAKFSKGISTQTPSENRKIFDPYVFSAELTELSNGATWQPTFMEIGHLGIPKEKNKPGEIISFNCIFETVATVSFVKRNAVIAPISIIDKNILEDHPNLFLLHPSLPVPKKKME